jgi:site-specific recombinase XerC
MSKLIKFITLEEFKKVLKAEKDREYKLAYALGFGSGLRISEIVGLDNIIKPLHPEQVNLQTHQIKVFGKGGKERITMMSKWVNEKNIKLLPLSINRRTLQRRFTDLCMKVLGKRLSFHSLRHGFANHLVNVKKMPLPMVQGFLGHSRLSTTGIYTRANPVKAVEQAWEVF